MEVLIFAHENDLHALAVQREVCLLGEEAIVIDTADIPSRLPISVWYNSSGGGHVQIGSHSVSTDESVGVWWRRPNPHAIDKRVTSPDVVAYSQRATRATLLGGVLSACNRIVNPVYKSDWRQLSHFSFLLHSVADVPRTTVTSSPSHAREFISQGDGVVYKTVTTWHYAMRETRLLEDEDIADLDSLVFAPDVFQEYINGPYDLRVTIVDRRVFAARVDFKLGRSPVDGRLDHVPIQPFSLDSDTPGRILEMHKRLGLVYGAYDFRVDNEGRPWFLEVNPDGQYLYVEIQTGLPISEALARYLSGKSCE